MIPRAAAREIGAINHRFPISTKVKTPISPAREIIPTNIIHFPSQLCRKSGVAGKSVSRTPPPAVMKSGGIPIRRLSLVSSQSEDCKRCLLTEAREILTRHSGVGAAMAPPRIDRLLWTGSRE